MYLFSSFNPNNFRIEMSVTPFDWNIIFWAAFSLVFRIILFQLYRIEGNLSSNTNILCDGWTFNYCQSLKLEGFLCRKNLILLSILWDAYSSIFWCSFIIFRKKSWVNGNNSIVKPQISTQLSILHWHQQNVCS